MNKVPYNKPALTYAEQLQRLKDRGLTIENDDKALHLLEVISYYRLSGYWYPLLVDKENHHFKPGASFETAFNLYKFDRELRLLVLHQLEKIEVAVRAKMIYVLSHSRGPFWYQYTDNFKNAYSHNKTRTKIKAEFQRSDEEFIKAFKSKYNNPLPPSWMLMEISSFGTVSNLYSNFVQGKDKREVAAYFGVNDTVLISWLHTIVYLRNVCAHHSRLWNRDMRIRPVIPKKTTYQWLVTQNTSNKKTFFVLSMIIYLMNTINKKHTIVNKFKSLLTKFPNIDVRAMGFPPNWESEPLWKEE